MASSQGAPNQPPPFDMHKLFINPSSAAATSAPPPPPYPPLSSYPPPQNGAFHPQFYHHYANQQQQQPFDQHPQHHHQFIQRSLSYPTPPLQPPSPNPATPNAGARLMALLSGPPQQQQSVETPTQVMNPVTVPSGLSSGHSGPIRLPSSKIPRGRHLSGDRVVYDVDVRLPGEVQPQLEVTPITKYNSDPQLVIGRQIAVNKTYICYGLNQGNIRVLNINTALRHLLRGHTQRVTDMAFFAEDVHLLASASTDGRVYVWKISESSEDEDKPEITAKTIVALHVMGEGESVHPRVCWHCHKQEVLVIGIGTRVLRIDTTKIGKGENYSAEDPLKCHVEKLIQGVYFVGRHDGEVTDLSMCQWMTSRLVSASADGTIKIWDERKSVPLVAMRPHEGQPVNLATFFTNPQKPDHIVLITGGPLNREVKLWVLESDEGWFLPSDAESWKCMQTLELKSSSESRPEEAFFNQVVVLPQSSVLLLANAKKNAIYAIHLEYGSFPAATRIDYIAEFTVTMPILSFTGTSDILPHGEHIVQVYCVQTQAIQQYALDLSQCLPHPQESAMLEKSDSTISRDATNAEALAGFETHGSKNNEGPIAASVPKITPASGSENSAGLRYPVGTASSEIVSSQEISSSSMDLKSVSSAPSTSTVNNAAQLPSVSPRLSREASDLRSPTNNNELGLPPLHSHSGDQQLADYPVDRQMDTIRPSLSKTSSFGDELRNDEKKIVQDDTTNAFNSPTTFKHPTHLVTPSEILMAVSSSESINAIEGKSEGEAKVQDVVVNSDVGNAELEVKVVNEAGQTKNGELIPQRENQNLASENKEKYFLSQASDLGIEKTREFYPISAETYNGDTQKHYGGNIGETSAQPQSTREDEHDAANDVSGNIPELGTTTFPQPPQPSAKGKKQKAKGSQASGATCPSPTAFNSTDSSNEPGGTSSALHGQVSFTHFQAMQEMLNQVLTTQKEMQKQMTTMVTVPVTKEGKRLEASLGRNIEKAIKANNDALCARIQEENSRNEKLFRERTQQLSNLITSLVNKEIPAVLEKIVKKEVTAVGQTALRAISPAIEKTVTSAITESFQRGVGDKAVNQLEKLVTSKLEATVARQIQAQFQTSGRQALQETLKSSVEVSLIPAFEKLCKAMFEQVDATFHRGMVEHTAAAQQQSESAHSQLALALREAINSATSITQTLSGELADGQRKLLALVASGANPSVVNPTLAMPVGGFHEKVEVPVDPTKELSRLISERKYEEAFTGALHRSDVSVVSWLCSQVDLRQLLSMVPLPLSQGVLLALLQQLACDIHNDTTRKLSWMTDIAAAINPTDPIIAVHVRPIFEQVYQILNHQRTLPSNSGADMSSIRLLMHVINSMLMTCK